MKGEKVNYEINEVSEDRDRVGKKTEVNATLQNKKRVERKVKTKGVGCWLSLIVHQSLGDVDHSW